MSTDHNQDPLPGARGSSGATAGESSRKPRNKIGQALGKITKSAVKKISKRFKRSRNHVAVAQNEGALSNQNIEDTLLHVSRDDDHLTVSENPIVCVSQEPSTEPASQVQPPPSAAHEGTGPQSAGHELRGAHDDMQNINLLGNHATSAADTAKNGPAGLDATDSFEATYLQPLKIFDTAIEKLSNVHPYAKMALGVLSAASKIIIAQAERDKSMHSLLEKLDEVYHFMTEDDNLDKMESMHDIVGQIVQQTVVCARFVRDYSKIKNFWMRLKKNVVSETDDTIKQYSDALDNLMRQFRDRALRDIAISAQRTERTLVTLSETLVTLGETLDLSDMNYARDAGLDTTKQCLPGTRTEILSQITDWINSSDDDAQRVMWLSGPAGTGKSAIAHTISKWFNDMGGLGSCFCFLRGAEGKDRHKKVFTTIARDLADRDPAMKRALADAVKNSTDILQQWEKLLMEPLGKHSGSSVGPVLIVIEALDESGGVETRSNLLRILAGTLEQQGLPKITQLPSNFRILVTSRPLHDIEKEFHGAQHILPLSMDRIPAEVAERDIRTFVSQALKGHSIWGEREIAILAAKSGGFFEWARLACEYIKKELPNVKPISRFNVVVNSGAGKRGNLLYNMYRLILTDIMNKAQYDGDEEYEEALAGFRSVMGQILCTAESLPFDSLKAMRDCFPDESKDYTVGR